MKKFLSLLLVFVFTLPLLFSCADKEADENSAEENQYPDFEGLKFSVLPNKTVFEAAQINCTPKDGASVIYTRDYKISGRPSLVIGEKQDDRVILSVALIKDRNGKDEFSIASKTEDAENAFIPYNGFAVSLPKSAAGDVRMNEGQLVRVEGYEKLDLEYERLDLASFSLNSMPAAFSRRVYIKDPVSEIKDNKIVFLSGEKEYGLPSSSFAVFLEQTTKYGYRIVSAEETDHIGKGSPALVFTGEYNKAYAEKYMKSGEKLMFSGMDEANSYSDVPCLMIGDEILEITGDRLNAESITQKGVYMYTSEYDGVTSPDAENDRCDAVLIDGLVATVTENKEKAMIPSGNGVLFTFVGDEYVKKAHSLTIGSQPKTELVTYKKMPDKYAKIGSEIFEITLVDGYRQPEGVTVLYTPLFGETTGTNIYGTEIVISDNKVKEIRRHTGDSAIPKDGYVLSLHKDSPCCRSLSSVKEGDEVSISLGGASYAVNKFKITAFNTTRFTDSLIVYDKGTKTGTNRYGYEIIVDKNGTATGASNTGDSFIPEGGFVVSGHGVNMTNLINAYILGEKIFVDRKTKQLTVIRTPELKITMAENDFEKANKYYDRTKKDFKNIDCKTIDGTLKTVRETLDESKNALKAFDFNRAITLALSVSETCNKLSLDVIESKGAENRAMWYRATETSDEEVEATVKKLKMLNVNALYLETWYCGDCIGKLGIEGVGHPDVHKGYDVLDGFIRIGHKYGIEIHAWVENFFIDIYKDGAIPRNELAEKWHDRLLLDSAGNDFFIYENDAKFIFLNPYDRKCRDFVLSVYKALIDKYDIDGFHMDYIRFPELNYGKNDFGYNKDIIDAFSRETGIKGDPAKFRKGTKEQKAWVDFRVEIITSFFKEVFSMISEKKPGLWLSAAIYPDPDLARKSIFQDVKTWVNNGWIDEVFSMTYNVDNGFVRENASMFADICKGKCFYSTGIMAFGDTTKTDFAYQLSDVREAGSDGVSVFALASINPKTYQNEIANGAFRDPAVQTYKFSDTVKAQIEFILSKTETLDYLGECKNEDEKQNFIASLKEIKAKADEKHFADMTSKEKLSYAGQTVKSLEAVKESAKNAYGDAEGTPYHDIEDLIYWLNLSADRVKARRK